MISDKTKIVGGGIALATAFVFLFIAVIPLLFGEVNDFQERLSRAQVIIATLGFIGATSGFSLAFFQYYKSARWKRMEFIANEIKDLESDPTIQNAFLMIDWGKRLINLDLVSAPKISDLEIIDRETQWKALMPDTIKKKYLGVESERYNVNGEKTDSWKSISGFTFKEAKIRDVYDVFLRRLDRFSDFIEAGLITQNELEPFIKYWIDAITENTYPKVDAKWRLALLTYIIFYEYKGVQRLMRKYQKDINPNQNEGIYQKVKESVEKQNKKLAKDLFLACEGKYIV